MYVLDYHRQISLTREMTVLRKDDDEWIVYYHHPSTNEMWKSFFPKANGKNMGPKILRTEPVPEQLEERLDLCLASGDRDDAMGLGIELSVNPARWEAILAIIEENFKTYDRTQLKLFFEYLCLFDYKKLFEELNITPDQYDFTEKDLSKLSWRARKILLKKLWFFW